MREIETLHQPVADHFIERVVAAHVFVQHQQVAKLREDSRGVNSAGGLEVFLGFAELGRSVQNDLAINFEMMIDGRVVLENGINGGLAAEAAGRG